MKILLLEPFYGGSHKQWAKSLVKHSIHSIEVLSLSAHHWKWRMSNAAVSLARRFNEMTFQPDLIIVSDMMNLAEFQALTKAKTCNIPYVLYMHENQITYPFQNQQAHDFHYGLINFKSALSADEIWFNSEYHKNSFITALPKFLAKFPAPNEKGQIDKIKQKSKIKYVGLNLDYFKSKKPKDKTSYNRAVILWNHRWEHDKNPEQFYKVLKTLKERGIEFKLVILGEKFVKYPAVFDDIQTTFKDELVHFGYVETRDEYAKWLWHSDILPVTSIHDFFGVSVVEAISCNVIPLLPKTLAYTEHLPKAYENSFFYNDEKDMLNKLQRMIMNVTILRKQKTVQFVEKYNWTNLISTYDNGFEDLISIFAKQ